MVKKSLQQICQIGLDFFEYLKETKRSSITQKEKLKEIYITEFRNGASGGEKDPAFGSLLYALGRFHLLGRSRRGRVHLCPEALHVDQWSSDRRKPSTVRRKETAAVVSTPPHQAESGVCATRTMAHSLLEKLSVQRAELTSDKHGIRISCAEPFTDGKMSLCVESLSEHVVHLKIENTSNQTVHFIYYTALYWLQFFSLEDEHKVTKKNPLTLSPVCSSDTAVFQTHNGIHTSSIRMVQSLIGQSPMEGYGGRKDRGRGHRTLSPSKITSST